MYIYIYIYVRCVCIRIVKVTSRTGKFGASAWVAPLRKHSQMSVDKASANMASVFSCDCSKTKPKP